MSNPNNNQAILNDVNQWLDKVVIGLNLCPFASQPYKNQQIRFTISHCDSDACLLEDLQNELNLLAETKAESIETTLLIVPNMLQDFYDYNDFLEYVDALIEDNQWQGIFQVATFHPNYQFGGTEPEDTENLTNRAPYPILHLLREASLEKAIEHYPNPEEIPEQNIETVSNLTLQQKSVLFPHIFKN
ncbi:DUF1415 domain-containing protein [Thiomicrorhabdus sp. Milos-T2]|uniref:DUF1415 domain-containing protein n=1 Tax=Thiomicrorhabdus sp. Milos-T2 TaxID=90814 RepID=UPI000493C075|nr:DUF1415 domain-containing protein [Thiomicrorhabdus sp. Milos-T2]